MDARQEWHSQRFTSVILPHALAVKLAQVRSRLRSTRRWGHDGGTPHMTNEANDSAGATKVTITHAIKLRVRYGETDQMGTVYNSRPLDWFECGRTELLRSLGLPYAEMEREGLFLPLIESHLEYLGRARYDDLLEVETTLGFEGRARLRCDVRVVHAEGRKGVVRGYTLHVFTDAAGKPVRPPGWIMTRLSNGASARQIAH